MIKGFIFDFDGVIMDTEKYHYLSWKAAAKKLKVEFSEEEYLPKKSTGRKVVIFYLLEKAKKRYNEKQFEKISSLKGKVYKKESKKLTKDDIIKGVESFLESIVSSGRKCAVASSSRFAKEMLTKFDLIKYFSSIVDGNRNLKPKPDPGMYLAAAEEMGLDAKECVVFEDSITGVKGALNGGFKVVGIGEYLKEYFKDIQVVENFENIEGKELF